MLYELNWTLSEKFPKIIVSSLCLLDLFNGNVKALFDDKKLKILTFPFNISSYWLGTIISEHLIFTLLWNNITCKECASWRQVAQFGSMWRDIFSGLMWLKVATLGIN